MFNHKLFATDGLFPGLTSPLAMATLGAVTVEIFIEPVTGYGGGGGFGPPLKKDKYKVTIRVTMKSGKVWRYERVVSQFLARVTARLVGKKFKPEPQVSITNVSITQSAETPNIKVSVK